MAWNGIDNSTHDFSQPGSQDFSLEGERDGCSSHLQGCNNQIRQRNCEATSNSMYYISRKKLWPCENTRTFYGHSRCFAPNLSDEPQFWWTGHDFAWSHCLQRKETACLVGLFASLGTQPRSQGLSSSALPENEVVWATWWIIDIKGHAENELAISVRRT